MMRIFKPFLAGVCTFFLTAIVEVPTLSAQNTPAPFAAGETWCAIGDEVTHHGGYLPMVELFYATRFPGRSLQVINAGLMDDTVSSAMQRLPWDVEVHKPDVVTILLGKNDIGRTLYTSAAVSPAVERMRAERIERFGSEMRSLVARVKSTGARVILMTPAIYDETVQGLAPSNKGANAALAECGRIIKDIANESGAAVTDVHGQMMQATILLQNGDPLGSIMETNRSFPAASGHLVMAYSLLRSQNVQGLVSRLVIDLDTNSILAADNGTAEAVEKDRSGVRFRWTENALPFPVQEDARIALALVPFQQELNQQVIQIGGLRPGTYEVFIDKELIGSVSADQLAAGINLAASINTPQYRQALEIQKLLQRKAELVADGLRSVALVEHRLAPKADRPMEITFMEPLVTDWKAKVGPDMLQTPMGKSVSLYLLRKDREQEAIASARRLTELAELAAMPRPHDYEIRLIRE